MMHPLFARHQETLHRALAAAQSRRYWEPYRHRPVATQDTQGAGREALEAWRGAQFYLDQPGVLGRCADESSPYGLSLGVSYPRCAPDALVSAGRAAQPPWVGADVNTRTGICLEMLERLHAQGATLAQAIMHTAGHPLPLASAQGVGQALARGLEAVAVAWREMGVITHQARFERTVSGQALRVNKHFSVVPRGVGLVLCCADAPTLMAFPAIFACLATGNAVVVKPNPAVVLPLALCVATLRLTLREFGFDANLVSLLVDDRQAPVGKEIATHPDVRLIDYCGRRDFALWLKENATQARQFVFSEASNCVVIDSTDNYRDMLRYLVCVNSCYAGQRSLSLQNIFLGAAGFASDEGHISVEQFCRDFGYALSKLHDDAARSTDLLGAQRGETIGASVDALRQSGRVVRDSQQVDDPRWPGARVCTPMLICCSPRDEALFGPESAAPVTFIVESQTSSGALAAAERVIRQHGALELLVYSRNENILALAQDSAARAGVRLSVNLVGNLAQAKMAGLPMAFSDLHGGTDNPASTAALVDGTFVSRRFSFSQRSSADR